MRKMSEEHRLKISLAMKGKSPPNKGKRMSEAQKIKIGIANTGKKKSPETLKKMSINTTRRLLGKRGENAMRWKGGRHKTVKGYYKIYSPDHPHKDAGNYVMEHRLIMEKKIGRFLTPKETVHHINSDKLDNRIENLILFKNPGEHIAHHRLTYNPTKKITTH